MSTMKNKYLLPIFDQLVDQLSGAKKFKNFDLRTGYNQIKILKNNTKNDYS